MQRRNCPLFQCFSQADHHGDNHLCTTVGYGNPRTASHRKCPSLGLARPAKRRNGLQYTVCKAMQVLLTQYRPMYVYLGHLVRQCNWASDNAYRFVLALEGLQKVICLLDRLNMGDTLLKYERTVATALLCHTAWHSAMPGQCFAEGVCESLLSCLVTKKGQNRGGVTIDDIDDLYHLISIWRGGHRVNVCKVPNSFVNFGASAPNRLLECRACVRALG